MNEFGIKDTHEEDIREYSRRQREKGKKNKIPPYLSTVVMLVIALALTTFSELLKFDISFKRVVWPAFIVCLISKLITMLLTKYIGADVMYRSQLDDEYVVQAKEDFLKLSKSLNTADFERWLWRENIRRKTEAYKHSILAKVARHDIKMRKLERRKMVIFRSARINRIKGKIADWRRVISNEYIAENIGFVRVKYNRLKAIDFETPNEKCLDENEKYSISEEGEIARDLSRGLPLAIVAFFVTNLVAGSYMIGKVNLLMLLYDSFLLAFYFFQGYYVTGKKVVATLIAVYRARRSVILRYNAERGTKTDDNADVATDTHAVQYTAPVVKKSAS